jgi:hypothetical protein
MHFMQRLYSHLKAVTKSAAVRVLTAPLPQVLEVFLGEGLAGQPSLYPGEEEEVSRCQIRQIRWVLDDLELPGCQPVGHMAAVYTGALSLWSHDPPVPGIHHQPPLRN